MIINFTQHWGYATADVACRICGRVSRRRVKEYCTENPYNRNEAGQIKTPAEVRKGAQEQADKEAARQAAEGRICRKCESQS